MLNTPIEQTRQRRAETRSLASTVAVTAVIFFFLWKVIFALVVVSGISMNPTLQSGNLVLARRFGLDDLRRGDIVVFDSTGVGKKLIKRIVAVGGDTVNIDYEAGIVTVNGKALSEPYIAAPTRLNEGVNLPANVPEGFLFVLGDNRNQSRDSRDPDVGMISQSDVIGKVFLRMWPFSFF